MKLSTLDLPDKPQEQLQSVNDADLPEGVVVEDLMYGLKTWVNPVNGFRILRLHYSADPIKRKPEWKLNERKKFGEAEWNREEELIWEALDGKPVYSEFWSAEFHTAKTKLGWNPKLTVVRGWDFGLNGACIFAQLFPHRRLFILRELVSEDIAFERLLDEVARLSAEWFPGASFVEFIDPSGRFRFGSNERTYAMMLANKPLNAKRILSGVQDPAARQKAVNDYLRENVKGLPTLVVDSSCETLIKGFNGGYLYKRNAQDQLKLEPEKNFFSHAHDALQYICTKIGSTNLQPVSTGVSKIKEAGISGKDKPNTIAA